MLQTSLIKRRYPAALFESRLKGCVLAIIACTGMLNACSVRDSAPANYTKRWHEIPDAVPEAVEPSRYGNPRRYEVMGKTYYVKDSADGFEQKGIASWYGNKFHGRRTSSGEDYDMYAMTAAHKTLPIPVYVEVTNTDNGRKAIVRVNDRGPFHEGRIIDLSYAAATKLGVAQTGTANVRIRVVDVDSDNNKTAAARTATARPGGKVAVSTNSKAGRQSAAKTISDGEKLYVQVAAFDTEKSALQHIKKLQGKGFFDVRLHVESVKGTRLYRVRIGPLPSEHVAKNVLGQLEENNYHDLKIVKNN